MRTSRRLLKMAAILQLVLALPRLASGSVCVSTDGIEHVEESSCACAVVPSAAVPLAFESAAADDCGPCREQAVLALRTLQDPVQPAPAEVAAFALLAPARVTTLVSPADPIAACERAALRQTILRC